MENGASNIAQITTMWVTFFQFVETSCTFCRRFHSQTVHICIICVLFIFRSRIGLSLSNTNELFVSLREIDIDAHAADSTNLTSPPPSLPIRDLSQFSVFFSSSFPNSDIDQAKAFVLPLGSNAAWVKKLLAILDASLDEKTSVLVSIYKPMRLLYFCISPPPGNRFTVLQSLLKMFYAIQLGLVIAPAAPEGLRKCACSSLTSSRNRGTCAITETGAASKPERNRLQLGQRVPPKLTVPVKVRTALPLILTQLGICLRRLHDCANSVSCLHTRIRIP